MTSGMASIHTIQAQLKKRIRAIRTRTIFLIQRIRGGIQQYLAACPSPPKVCALSESALPEDLPPPFIDEIPTQRQELLPPSGRLPSEQQLLDMFHLGKKEGIRETQDGPPIHQVPVPVAPVCEACLKEGQIIPLWKDPISEYETYSYCPKCAIKQGKHYAPTLSDAPPVAYPELREQLTVRRMLLRREQAAWTHQACFTPFAPLSYVQERAAHMETEEEEQDSQVDATEKRQAVKKAG